MAQLVKNPSALWEAKVQSLGREDSPGEGSGHPLQYSSLVKSMDCSPSGASVLGTLQARILELVAMSSSGGSSQRRDRTQVSYIAGGLFTISATREACP